MECVGLDDFPASGAAERKRAAAREELAAEAGQVEDKEGANAEERAPSKRGRFEDGHPVVIYILDPEDAYTIRSQVWNWNTTGVKKLGVLYEASLNALHVKVSSQLPDGWKLLIVLHWDPAVRTNSPPPAMCNASTYYFNLGRFDGPEYYMDEIEDSEEEVTRRIGGRRGVPRRDHKFEESLEDCRCRICRQQWVLADLETKHKAAFHDAIHESDAEGGLRVVCYREGDKLTSKQVVQFRAVVADYVMDLAARATANTEAGGGLTNRQLVRRAMRHMKAEINRSVIYATLGLPQTEA
ncbi:hypothetical protein BGX38DRAFT_1272839 [Terfezia claveryi]|nr:hypothetical protein BGX38DRAFT_1272839 [Terfezia claveryi]